MKQKYGHFDRQLGEFVITNPATPRPWINYLFNRDYCALISGTAGGYSFYLDCRQKMLTRWQGQNLLEDQPGRYVYIRDDQSGQFWSASWRPVKAKYTRYAARHGMGYTTIEQTANDIESSVTYFVPADESMEIWDVTIRNVGRRARKLSTFSCAEMMVGNRDREMMYRNITPLYNRSRYNKDLSAIECWKETGQIYKDQGMNGFFASNVRPAGFDIIRESFLGPVGGYDSPAAVQSGQCSGSVAYGEDMIPTLHHRFTLKPGQSKRLVILMGTHVDGRDLRRKLRRFNALAGVKSAMDAVKKQWQAVRESIVVQTPDEQFDTIVNDWVKYQLFVANFWSRSPSFYHEGFGGFGFRDSAQDAEGIVSLDRDYAEFKINKLLEIQKSTGQPMPGWSPIGGVYPHHPFKDHPIWLPFTVSAYVKETGDMAFLDRKVAFLDGEPDSVYEHLKRSVLFIAKDTGKRGFIHFGQFRHADWNDAFDGCTEQAESVWLTMGLCRSLLRMIELAELTGRKKDATQFRRLHAKFAKLVNDKAWDGQWYTRGFDNKGQVIGSRSCKQGKVFLNSQSWAVLGGVAEGKRLEQCLDASDKHLLGEHGYRLLAPAYTGPNDDLGRITRFCAGVKENGAVFCHAVAFMIAALCQAGRGERALSALKNIMPIGKDSDVYKAEPYAFAEYVTSEDHPNRAGEAAFTWITGTASWAFVVATQWIVGARPDYEGLRIDPCVPKSWKRFSIRRPFRGAVYEIEVRNPKGVQKGVKQITVDGQSLEGSVVPAFGDGKVHKVQVVMG